MAEGMGPTVASIRRVAGMAPPNIVRATVARLGRLPEDAVALARSIALLGAEASLPRAAALCHLAEERALAALDALIDADMVTTEGRLDLRHPACGLRSTTGCHLAPVRLCTAGSRRCSRVKALNWTP